MNTPNLSLNPEQNQAVSSDAMHSLILAGAGSGKTRVLVQRVIWLIQNQITTPYNILAVTFTNKAAKEMTHRINQLLEFHHPEIWVGTFHGIAHKILRVHYEKANLPKNFQILDSAESKSVVKSLIKQNNLGHILDDKETRGYIDWQKENGRRWDNPTHKTNNAEAKMEIYKQYQMLCDANGWVDFTELLLRTYELFQKEKIIAEIYQSRFKHILVDEFQDTNTIQYLWLKALNSGSNQFFVVGDDDQSIYSWRGAKVENIRAFEKEFEGADVIRLEQNYRSTAPILKAANSVISKNNRKYPKELWTENEKGDLIDVFSAFNDLEEARFVIASIENAKDNGTDLANIGVLYRTNAQSRVLEEELLKKGINYIIYGGLRFYERAEIKDAMSYLKLINSRNDNLAFERVLQTPSKGIGARSIEKLREVAQTNQCSLWNAIDISIANQTFNARTAGQLLHFKHFFDELDQTTSDLDLASTMDTLIEKANIISHYQKEADRQIEVREDNLKELVRAADQFDEFDENIPQRIAFCDHAALEAGEFQAEKGSSAVQLMSLHSAKGLEFDFVFIVGIEEGLFPSHQSLNDKEKLEEERRLFYVGITRAKKKLHLSFAQSRRVFGQTQYYNPARFLTELPKDCVNQIRVRDSNYTQKKQEFSQHSEPKIKTSLEKSGFKTGDQVTHERFGKGVVLGIQGEKIYIHFHSVGQKCLLASLAKLK